MAHPLNDKVTVICTATGQEVETVIIWNKEVWWKGYAGAPRLDANGDQEFESWDFHDDDYVDTLHTEYECRSCNRDNLPIDHFRFIDSRQPAAATHGGRL